MLKINPNSGSLHLDDGPGFLCDPVSIAREDLDDWLKVSYVFDNYLILCEDGSVRDADGGELDFEGIRDDEGRLWIREGNRFSCDQDEDWCSAFILAEFYGPLEVEL